MKTDDGESTFCKARDRAAPRDLAIFEHPPVGVELGDDLLGAFGSEVVHLAAVDLQLLLIEAMDE